MFDTVGRTIDAGAGQRQLTAVALTAVVVGTFVGGVALYGAWRATRYVLDQLQDDGPMVEVVMQDPGFDAELPPPPPPPPPPAAASADEDTPKDPDEMSDEIKTLDEQVAKVVKDEHTGGQEGGQEGGQAGGVVGGVVGGTPGGVIGGQLGKVHVFHHSEVKIKRRVQPRYPAAAEGMNLGDVVCRVVVSIDEKGVPYDVQPQACPKIFHQEVEDALFRWRWYPAKVQGEAVKGQFLMAVHFVP